MKVIIISKLILTKIHIFNIMEKKKIAVLGLGYVGLPLAVSLSSSFKVIGFDISLNRLVNLSKE